MAQRNGRKHHSQEETIFTKWSVVHYNIQMLVNGLKVLLLRVFCILFCSFFVFFLQQTSDFIFIEGIYCNKLVDLPYGPQTDKALIQIHNPGTQTKVD